MTKFDTENQQAIRELGADEIELVSGGSKASTPKEKPEPFIVYTMETVLVSSVN
jgi:hypothetical protein